MKRKIVITGGHLTPALSVIDELIERGGWEIYFIGRKYASEGEKTPSIESQIVPDRGIWFFPITAGRFFPHLNRYALLGFLKIPLGFLQAFYYLLRLRPQIVLSFGGYVSVPLVTVGWLLGIPSLTHEQTIVKGLATKINIFFTKKIAVSWPKSLKQFPKKKVVLTGNPIRREYFQFNQKIWEILKFPQKLPLVFITGGNQGSHVINKTTEAILPHLLKIANVFHQCGHLKAMGDFERLEKTREKLPEKLKKRYHVKKYLTAEEMGTFLNMADLVVSRSGANIVTEIAALGKPALFIPLPWIYQDEQTKNARILVDVGLAEILPQKDLSEKTLYQRINKIIQNLEKYEKNSKAAQSLVKLDAAKNLVDEVEKIL